MKDIIFLIFQRDVGMCLIISNEKELFLNLVKLKYSFKYSMKQCGGRRRLLLGKMKLHHSKLPAV